MTLGLEGTTGLGLEANAFEGGGILFPLVEGEPCEEWVWRGGGEPARASRACIGLVAGERDRCRDEDLDLREGEESEVERETLAGVGLAGVRRGMIGEVESSLRRMFG